MGLCLKEKIKFYCTIKNELRKEQTKRVVILKSDHHTFCF